MAPAPPLPLQPQRPDLLQRRLSRDFLGDLEGLARHLEALRQEADKKLQPVLPVFAGKPYPLGRCREIRDKVFEMLGESINTRETPITRSLHHFISQGGLATKIWGVLRESYFQNAIQIGSYYVDVANDTVDPRKPKIEILRLADSGMTPVNSLEHFKTIAERYWNARVYANTVFPGLAPFFPMICVSPSGAAWLEPASNQVFELIRRAGLVPSLEFLREAEAPPVAVRHRLLAAKQACVSDLACRSGNAVDQVERAIRSGLFEDADFLRSCRTGLLEAKKSLDAIQVEPSPNSA